MLWFPEAFQEPAPLRWKKFTLPAALSLINIPFALRTSGIRRTHGSLQEIASGRKESQVLTVGADVVA